MAIINKPSLNSASGIKHEVKPIMEKLPPKVPSLSKVYDAKHKYKISLQPRKVSAVKEPSAVVTPLKKDYPTHAYNFKSLEAKEFCFESPKPIRQNIVSTASVVCKPEPRRLTAQPGLPIVSFPSLPLPDVQTSVSKSLVLHTPIPN